MRKTLLALAAAATLAVSAASPAYAGPRTYPGPGGYPYWSGYVDALVGPPIPPATGIPSASGTVMPGACAACASAADQVAAVGWFGWGLSVPRRKIRVPGVETLRARAKSADVAAVIKGLRAVGKTSPRELAEALNEAGIRTARGKGKWSAVQVQRVLERIGVGGI
jgi:hypothetical protein